MKVWEREQGILKALRVLQRGHRKSKEGKSLFLTKRTMYNGKKKAKEWGTAQNHTNLPCGGVPSGLQESYSFKAEFREQR